MVFVSQDERIQRQLIAEAATGPFHPVTYDKNTKQKTVDLDPLEEVNPSESYAQAISTSFGVASRNRRTDRRERKVWRWHLACRFPQEVSIEEFEKRLLKNIPLLARDQDNDLAQVKLILQSADPFHPPQQHPNTGTQVVFVFDAELSPV